MGCLNRKACRCPGKVGTVPPKLAFLATVVAPTVALPTWTSVPRVGSSTCVTPNSALLRRKAPRLLRLMVWSIIRSPPLLRSGPGPRWSTDPLRRLWLQWALTFHLTLHLLHHSDLLYQSSKILDGQWCHHQANISPEAVLKLTASPLLVKRQGVETAEVFEPLSILCDSLPSLGQLEELYLLGVPDVVGKVLGEESLPESLP